MKGAAHQAPPKISIFKKKVIDDQVRDIKAYRKQFEDPDHSLKSWKPERSGSPCTPQASTNRNRKVFFMEPESTYIDEKPSQDEIIEPMLMPIRQQSDIVTLQM